MLKIKNEIICNSIQAVPPNTGSLITTLFAIKEKNLFYKNFIKFKKKFKEIMKQILIM